MSAVAGVRRLGFGLSRELWLVQVGIFLNLLGYGAVLPFEVLYLHDGRGFGLGVAGLVVGTVTGVAVVTAPLAGVLIDRLGARTTAAASGVALAVGYAGLALAAGPLPAFAAAAVAGAGNGAWIPSQSTLVATLEPPELRHRASAISRVAVNAGAGFGGALGGVVAAQGLPGLQALFLANAVTYVAYVAVLLLAVRREATTERAGGGYRAVLRDRPFVHLALTNVALIAVGWGVLAWVVPPYASQELGLGARQIGLLLFFNAATVVVAQVPIVRLAEGRRRVVMLAVAAAIFVGACLLLAAAQLSPAAAYPALALAAVAFALGECFHATSLLPLAAELAPPALRGRYMAAIGFTWWGGLTLAPTLGAQLLGVSPTATLLAAAAVAGAAGVSALALERRLPPGSRRTPRPGG